MRSQQLGSRLLGRSDRRYMLLRVRIQFLLTVSLVSANLIGAAVVIALITLVIPGPDVFIGELTLVHVVLVPSYVLVAVFVGILWGTRRALRSLRWVFSGKEPDAADRRATLRVPWRLTRIQGVLWLIALVGFTIAHGLVLPDSVAKVAFTVGFGGIVVCANSYLLSEFALRPIAARALSIDPLPTRRSVSAVSVRMLLAWGLGTGVPVSGLMLVAVFALVRGDVSSTQLSITILALGSVILMFGFLLMVFTARATSAPIRTVRRALSEVERGRLDTEVVVFDGTELGLLQAGFNRMVGGLREREQIRDLFGRHVGTEVAQEALSGKVELGGEVREVAVLFVDVIGSTTLAATRPPTEVVDLLNRFFAVVVAEIARHNGMVNKFEGDAALAVFGAPGAIPDAAGQALAAARAMARRLRAEVPECQAGIGVAAGPAVAGNIGEKSRYEYTVIGDPVNEAARLTELAKSVDGRTVASMAAVRLAGEQEAERWRGVDETVLRGRTEATVLAAPAEFLDQVDVATVEATT